MILGHGIDIVSVKRVEEMVKKWGEHFLKKIYTQREIEYCKKKKKNAFLHFASRFAAKEALLKAMGTGISNGISLSEIEVGVKKSGAPMLHLKGRTLDMAKKKGIKKMYLSLSDEEHTAIASVILEK